MRIFVVNMNVSKLRKLITKTLSTRLTLMVVFEIALLLLVSMGIMFYYSRQSLREEAILDAEQTLKGTIQQIDNILLMVEQTAGNVYWDLLPHIHQSELMEGYCRRVVESNSYIVGCAIAMKPDFYPEHGPFMIYVHRKGYKVLTEEAKELVSQNTFTKRPYTEQVWYTSPVETAHACWTDPLKEDETEGEALVTFCLPFFDENKECIGDLAVDLPLSLLSKLVLASKPSVNGYTTMLARNGSYMVHPDSTKLLHHTVFSKIDNSADHTMMEAAEAMLAGEKGLKPFLMDGRKWYVVYSPLEREEVPGRVMEPLGWSVGVCYPENDIFGSFNNLFIFVPVIAIIGLLIFFVLCRMVTHRQLHPLRLLTHSAQRIADGNYGETIPDSRREDEIGLLQDHFQHMQRSLADQVSEQEQLSSMLQERGKELQEAYMRAQKADRMKTAFLHNMTNQMIAPSDTIVKSVTTLCDQYNDISLEKADTELDIIRQQSLSITNLLNDLVQTSENDTGKEGGHE